MAQPALFAVQVGITSMLRRRGVVPVAVAGHSVGEVAAAWASGSLSLAAAVSVIHHRSALQGTTKGSGRMTAVNIGEPRAREYLQELGLSETLSVAGVNSSRGVTIAGPESALDRFEGVLSAQQRRAQTPGPRLCVSQSGHGWSVLASCVARLRIWSPKMPTIPFHSTVTGERLPGKSLNAEYWWRNIREPVLFEQAIRGMVDGRHQYFPGNRSAHGVAALHSGLPHRCRCRPAAS